VRAFFQDLRARGLGDPLLVAPDSALGIIRAIEECFPRSARQRCLARRMRNLAVKVPIDLPVPGSKSPGIKARVGASYQVPSRVLARQLASGVRADYADLLPQSVRRPLASARRASARYADDEPARTAVRRGAPTVEDHRQRLRRKAVLKLTFGALIRAANSPPSERNSTRNIRPRSRSRRGAGCRHPCREASDF
jgi:putative transposase